MATPSPMARPTPLVASSGSPSRSVATTPVASARSRPAASRAAQHLGQTETARADYDTFLKYCLDDAEHQAALHERQALGPAIADY